MIEIKKQTCYNDVELIEMEVVEIKVAIISDIHGNSVALENILKDAEKNNVDDYIFSGDIVNDLPFGNETLELVKKYSNKVLKGNKEQYLLELEQEKYDWTQLQFKNVIFMYNELTEENKAYIRNLPHTINVEYDGVKLCIAHGSPKSVEEQLKQEKRDLLDKYTKDLDADCLIFGHTHEKMWKEYINNKLVINAGCSGVSPYYIGKAEYVILTIENKEIKKVDFRLVDYNVEIIKQKIIECGILDVDKVLMNVTYMRIIRVWF